MTSDRLDAIRERLASVPDGWIGQWFTAADLAYLLAEVERLRAKNTELNRRCTKAEAFAGKTVDEMRATPGHAGFGRALANWAAADAHRKLDEMKAEVERLEREKAEAWDAGWQDAHADHNDNPYRKETP